MSRRVLLVGLGVANRAVAGALVPRGIDVVVVDDHPSVEVVGEAESLDVELVESPTRAQLLDLVTSASEVVPSPGVPDDHPVMTMALDEGIAVRSELDIASRLDDRPKLAVTGTDGKTTVTTLVEDMLVRSGTTAIAAGNNDLPLVEAVARPDVEVFVVEASSFQLGHTAEFLPSVGAWLNFAQDHLDVHRSEAAYEQAKARIWQLPPDGVAVANAADPVVMRHAPNDRRTVTFDPAGVSGYRVVDGVLVTDAGDELVATEQLPRSLPHDLANALGAAATALEGGATLEGVRGALTAFSGLPHRVQRVAEVDRVRYVDDSKATAPHATLAALASFDDVVLIAGGQNKGLDLTVLRSATSTLRGVIAIGEAAPDVVAALGDTVPVTTATSMAEAVERARSMALPGDVVLLSPGCASFDWYGSYGERGDDFRREVGRLAPPAGATS